MTRTSAQKRTTKETDISLTLAIDGTGVSKVASGNGFMDHMLTLFAKHGLFDLDLKCNGDTHVDFHHSAEDIGITLGKAFDVALGDRMGITRFATAHVPMDESLARVCVDISGRSTLVYNVELTDRTIGDFECDLVQDFLKAVCDNARVTLHADLLRGRNSHHSIEAVFKALGQALCAACGVNRRAPQDIPSTKGMIAG